MPERRGQIDRLVGDDRGLEYFERLHAIAEMYSLTTDRLHSLRY